MAIPSLTGNLVRWIVRLFEVDDKRGKAADKFLKAADIIEKWPINIKSGRYSWESGRYG